MVSLGAVGRPLRPLARRAGADIDGDVGTSPELLTEFPVLVGAPGATDAPAERGVRVVVPFVRRAHPSTPVIAAGRAATRPTERWIPRPFDRDRLRNIADPFQIRAEQVLAGLVQGPARQPNLGGSSRRRLLGQTGAGDVGRC